MPGERARVGELLVEQDMGERGEEEGVGAGADGDVPVGEAGGAGAARVDDGEGAAASAQRLEPAGEVGGGAEAAVGFEGLAPRSSRWPVRSRSGTAMAFGSPKSSPLETCLGIWSRVLAVNRARVRRAESSADG